MQLDVTHRNYEPTKRVLTAIEEKAEKFNKYIPDLIRVRFTLVGEKVENICEIHIHGAGKDFHVKSSTGDMLSALDKAAGTMEQLLRRHKTKRSDHNARFGPPGVTSAAALEASLEARVEVTSDEGDTVTGDEES